WIMCGPASTVDHDRPSGDGRRRRAVDVGWGPVVVVVDHGAGGLLPDLDPELVAGDAVVVSGDEERVADRTVHGPDALVLRLLRAGHDEPVVAARVEVQADELELELGLAGRNTRALLVLRDEPEVGAPGLRLVGPVRARRREDPAAASDEPGGRVVDDDHDRLRFGSPLVVGDSDRD